MEFPRCHIPEHVSVMESTGGITFSVWWSSWDQGHD